MKLFKRSFIFFFLFLGLIAIRLEAASSENRFVDQEKGFSINFPKDWKTQKELQGTAVIGFSQKEGDKDSFLENVNIVVSNPKLQTEDPQQYFEMNRGPLAELEGFKEIQRGTTTIEGKKAIWIIFTHQTGGIDAKAIQYYLVRSPRGYVITGTGLTSTFEKYKPKFDQVAKSFKTLKY